MKKIFDLFAQLFLLIGFSTIVFLGGLLLNLLQRGQNNKISNPEGLFSVFSISSAQADAPVCYSDGGHGEGGHAGNSDSADGGGSQGCSADGAGE